MLPERRKSADEIAKLRESLGISGEAQAEGEETAAASEPTVPPSENEEAVKSVTPARQVRSLRKSEQKPAEFSAVQTKNGIPVRRHDDRELMEIRRVQATPPDKSIAYIQQLGAPWPLVVLGYLFPFIGAACGLFAAFSPKVPEPDLQYQWLMDLSRAPWLDKAGFGLLVACCAIGLIFAAWFALKKPRSRHHAGFIVIFAVIIVVFGLIHQFNPNGP
ncbi:hypothetical protein [Luteolibacter soli]|uniref:Uncharacterized protein n=1 Tax=Luteolibacter soli TaxID=3135280 RepID=A0ABU9AUR6_9BACT